MSFLVWMIWKQSDKSGFVKQVKRLNTPMIETKRLVLRKFTEKDIIPLFLILKDEEVNKFLPWYPMKNIEETQKFYEVRYVSKYAQPQGYAYAICLKDDNLPIGYINVSMDDSYELGYGLRKEFWHKGIVTEAGKAVIEQLRKDKIPYITATHDIDNPRSGGVMKQIGMEYQYSYEEQVKPKNVLVTFRMYQLNLDGNISRVYQKFWNNSSVHFVETDI